MTKREACERWMKDWSLIPVDLIQKAYPYPDEIEILAPTFESFKEKYRLNNHCEVDCDECDDRCYGEYEEWNPLIPMWGWVFMPNNVLDRQWLVKNAEDVAEKCDVIVYYTDELGPYIGINGMGYDFYEEHWLKMYDLRGLKWHDEED